MVITYYGISCFKVQSGDTVLAFDPPSKKSGVKAPRFQADVVLVSHNHDNHNGVDNMTSKDKGEKDFFLIDGPGEYEAKGMFVQGIQTFHDQESGKKHGLNSVYVVNFENIDFCFLGDFGEKELRAETRESIGDVDVLFVPIGGESVTDIRDIIKIINQIEPKVVIPMHYMMGDQKQADKTLSNFLKELGQDKIVPVDKFTFKKKDILDKKGEVVVLK
ncbi:MAG: MBL fold metallo-hydrolase [Candidatus Marinimicrobia bacterium]|nr:MBL fold metallo-hydrolase [Candidatus Neomarinimicrobiota bacterium]